MSHLTDRIALRVSDPVLQRAIVARCETYAARLPSTQSHAVYVYQSVTFEGDNTRRYGDRTQSNGTLGVVIIRNGMPATFMWRRDNQPATCAALRVDNVWHSKTGSVR